MEFFFFIFLTGKSFDYTDSAEVFLYYLIQAVVLLENLLKIFFAVRIRAASAIPRTGIRSRYMDAIRALIVNAMMRAKRIINGARIATRMIIIKALWMFMTSVVSRVTRPAVENLSMLEKEKSWMLLYISVLIFRASPDAAVAAVLLAISPKIRAKAIQPIMIYAVEIRAFRSPA